MATILENESAWSTTAATNANVDTGIGWAENQDPASVNNSARGQMAARAKARLDQGGALVAGGSANALTVTTNQVLSAAHIAAGQRLAIRATAANTTAAVTLAVDGLTARNIKRSDGSALVVGSITSGMMLDLVYNAGSSEWRAVNIAPPADIATQADQETATSVTLAVTPGRQQFHPSAAKCWAVVTVAAGVPTLATSYNVTSITDNAVGDLTVTVATDFSSANWACVATGEHGASARIIWVFAKAAGSARLISSNAAGTSTDPDSWSMLGLGDQ